MRFRKLLALLLSLLMVLTLLPAVTFAAGGGDLTKSSGDCPMGGTHQWRGWYSPAPTCTDPGAISWVCDKCEMDAYETVPALGHDWSPWETVYEATCTADGQKVRYCNRCGIRELGTIPALGHDMHDKVTAQKEATCTEDGYKEYTEVCSRCGATGAAHVDNIPALGHDWGPWKTHLEPTCEEKGKRHHTCKRCNWTGNGSIDALGHDWDDGVVTKEPTPEAPGEMTYTCKRDPSHTYTVEIPYDGTPLPAPVTKEPEPSPEPDPEIDPDLVQLELTATKIGTIKPVYHEGDPVEFELRLKNNSDENVENPRITEYWEENGHAYVNTYKAVAVLSPGEEYVVDGIEHIIADDVANGHVTFSFMGMADRVSDGMNLLSNTASLTWDTEDEPPEFDEYALHLDVFHTIPKTEYIVDEYGNTEEVPFYLVVTNTGTLPLVFKEYTVTLNGIDYTLSEPAQYLKPSESYAFTLSGTILNEAQITPGTQTASTLGIVTLCFTAHGDEPDGGIRVCDSNTVIMDHTLVEPGPWTPGLAKLTIEKVETSSHVNPKGYILDDIITYDIIVTNTGDVDIPVVEIHDDHFDDGGGGDLLAVITNLAPAESRTVNLAYVVTQADVDAKWVINNATAKWQDPVVLKDITTPAIPVKSPTTDEPLPGGLVIVKSVIGGPDNGSYYVPGEKITFHVAVTNTMDIPFADIWIYDAYNAPVYIGVLDPHDTYEWSYDYEATEADAKILGYVSNIAYGWGFAGGNCISATSNEVIVPVHYGPPKVPMLELTKEETSTPANGSYYVAGEIIDYVISAKNVGETVIYDVCLYDSLDSPPVEYAHFGVLNPNEQQSALYDHIVTEEDVANGQVENWALADYSVYEDDGITVTWYSTYAGPVYSPTGKNPVIKKKTPTPGKADSCKLTLRGVGAYTLTEEQHYCTTHKAVREQVAALTAAAYTDAEKAAAWQQGVSLWRAALETEYEELMAACEGAGRLAVMAEKTAFDNYLGRLNTMLQAVYPDDAALVSRFMCIAIEEQCTELCYLGSNAGAARPDSMYSGTYAAIENDAAAAKCTVSENQVHSGDVMFTVRLCEEHGRMLNTSAYLVQGTANRTAAEDTFRRIRRVWQGGLDQATNAKYRAADGDARTAVSAFRMALDQLLEKQADMLNRLYPDNPEIAAEVISNMVRDQLLILCGIW